MEEKYCNDPNCTQVNPQSLSNFYTQKRNSKEKGQWIYYNPECKACTKRKATKWRKENPEQYKEIVKKRDKREETKIVRKRYADKKREEGYYSDYRKRIKDKIKGYNLDRKHKNHKISNQEWEDCKKYFNYECAYCGIALSEHYIVFKGERRLGDFHREHVDDHGENDLSNCVPSCKICNSKKHTYFLEEWYNENNKVFDIQRLDNIYKWLNEDYQRYIKMKLNN